jgi:hypothetical protein
VQSRPYFLTIDALKAFRITEIMFESAVSENSSAKFMQTLWSIPFAWKLALPILLIIFYVRLPP